MYCINAIQRIVTKFLDEIKTKVLRIFLLFIHSHLYSFVLRIYFFKLTQPLTVSYRKLEENHTPFRLV
jgi:hypothetical protein